jgi:GNAT superfamily N-acetyltransferase
VTAAAGVVGLERRHLRPVGEVLSRAFDDDPLPRFVSPSAARRPAVIRSFLVPIARDAIAFGHASAAVADGAVHGIAAWLPPGAYPPGMARQLRQLPGLVRIAALVPRRMPFVLDALAQLQQRHCEGEHWYLALLAVDPSRQGQGVGRTLLEPGLARADAGGLPCFLETTKRDNVAWYGNVGFDVVDELHVRDGPPIWTMARPPR